MDICWIILVLLIILLAICITEILELDKVIVGGEGPCSLPFQKIKTREGIPNDSAIIVDGMNFIYHLQSHRDQNKKSYLTNMRFFSLLDESSNILTNMYNKERNIQIHFILKNLNGHALDVNDPLIRTLIDLSGKYPIVYHLAFDPNRYRGAHYLEGRDDLLVQLLFNNMITNRMTYVISLDEYVDSVYFRQINPFTAIIFENGSIQQQHVIVPQMIQGSGLKSISGMDNLLKYEIIHCDEKSRENGELYDTKSNDKCLNIKDLNFEKLSW